MLGLGVSAFLIRKARKGFRESRLILASICGIAAAAAAWASFNVNVDRAADIGMFPALHAQTSADPANEPIGCRGWPDQLLRLIGSIPDLTILLIKANGDEVGRCQRRIRGHRDVSQRGRRRGIGLVHDIGRK